MGTTTRRARSRKVNKSAWIRALPRTMPAKDVVEKAKGEGITLSIAQVYTTRSAAKKVRGRGRPARGPRGPRGQLRVARGGDDLLTFKRLVLSIGLPRAEAYLQELRRSVGL